MSLESIPVHGAASPSSHPSAAIRFLDHPVDRVAQLGREFGETLERVYPALDVDVSAQLEKIRKNRDLTPEARTRQANELKRQAADAAKEKARGEISYVLGRVEQAVEHATKEMEKALPAYSAINTEEEVRKYIRALPADKRTSFIIDQARKGDGAVVAAALRAPRFLVGLEAMSDEGFADLRYQALATLNPEGAEKVAELRGLRKAVSDALAGIDPGKNDLPGSPFLQ